MNRGKKSSATYRAHSQSLPAGVKAKKSLGQNFLTDKGVLRRIASVADVHPGERIFEIGPGTGLLTQTLVESGAQILAVELDATLVERLRVLFAPSDQVSLLEGSILDMHLEAVLAQAGYQDQQYKVVANIPYYITAPIIRTLLSLQAQPSSITLMVQNEVADRLVAGPGGMSLLSVMAQYYARVEKCFVVPRTAFEPVPAVESAIIQLIPERRFNETEDRRVFRVIRAGFSARRKTLANNLANTFHLERSRVEEILTTLHIPLLTRAQELSIDTWRTLANALVPESE